jgi:cytochrome c biogenesis protein CcmG, thiol:disulfide interchange protein DsbE
MSGTPPPTDDITVELAEDLARQPTESPPPTRRVRRNVVGPFSLRQVTLAITAVMASAIVFTVATAPINQLVPNLPIPNPSAFLIGSPEPGLTIGDLAPELAVDLAEGRVELTNLDGQPIRLADLRGKAVWINFWASWCPPCQYETPTVRSLDQRYRDRGLVVVAIQVQQTVEAGRDYAERYGLEYMIGSDVTGDFFHLYRVFALPTQFFIDPEGRIRKIVIGPVSDADAATTIESILPSGSSPQPSPNPRPSAS